MVVRGATPQERAAAREVLRRKRRLTFFTDEIRNAATGRQRLQQACAFAKAVGDDLDDTARTEMAREIAAVADRRNQS